MELAYTLTPEDLAAGLRTVHLERVQRLRRSKVHFAASIAFVGAALWPFTALVLTPLAGRTGAITAHLTALCIAAPVAFLIRMRLSPTRLLVPGLADWALRRQFARALPKSVLGPIVLRVSESGLWRKNERDELTVSPRDVVRALWSTECALVQLRSRRILMVPARVFEGPEHEARVRDAMSRALGRPFVDVPLPPAQVASAR